MKWNSDEADSSDMVDRRGASGRSSGLGGIGGAGLGAVLGALLGGRRRKGGVVGLLIVVVVVVVVPMLMGGGGFDISTAGINDLPGLDQGRQLPGQGNSSDVAMPAASDPNPELTTFANVIITDTNNVWQKQFEASNRSYDRAKMVLFTGGVESACGRASSAMGPFYCPADEQVYIDLGFFDELATRFGAAGDFAQAYVIAHEVGHHVQNELGINAQVRKLEQQDPGAATGPKGLSVRTELQADCLAGVWAHSRYERGQADPSRRLDDGDIDEALRAASGVGDDSIQKLATGRVNPDSFTHGKSSQRARWFKQGYNSGDSSTCDTFGTDDL
ncbi:MAG: neutral zinc metallopeptidase [Microthrixaceae bacterium]